MRVKTLATTSLRSTRRHSSGRDGVADPRESHRERRASAAARGGGGVPEGLSQCVPSSRLDTPRPRVPNPRPIPARLANRHRTQPGADLPFLSPPADAQRSGVANEAAKGGAASMFSRKTMSIEEARSILGVDAQCTLEDVMGRYAKMFEANEKNGSFYLQSKIHRAKERMEAEFLGEGGDGDGDAGAGDGADAARDAAKNPNAGRGFAARGVEDAPEK